MSYSYSYMYEEKRLRVTKKKAKETFSYVSFELVSDERDVIHRSKYQLHVLYLMKLSIVRVRQHPLAFQGKLFQHTENGSD